MFGTYDEPAEPERRQLDDARRRCRSTARVGNPNPGSLKVVAPYSGANQYVDVQKSFGTGNPQDWTGKTLHVRIRVTEGTFTGGAQVYAITTGSFVFGGKYTNFMPNNNWQEFTVDVSAPTNGAAHRRARATTRRRSSSFGVQLNTGSAGAGATPVTFNIDSFSIDPPIAGATGTAGTTAARGTTGGATAPAAAATRRSETSAVARGAIARCGDRSARDAPLRAACDRPANLSGHDRHRRH